MRALRILLLVGNFLWLAPCARAAGQDDPAAGAAASWLDASMAPALAVARDAGSAMGSGAALALLALVPLAAVELAKAARWRVLCGPPHPPYGRSLRAVLVGQLTNALAPLRAGDAVRLGLLAAEGSALAPAAAALAGAKALDAVGIAAVATTVVGSAALAHAGWSLAAGGLVGLTGLILALRGTSARRWLDGHPLARRARLGALVDVASTLRDPRALVAVAGATSIVWLAGLAANGLVLAAVGVAPGLDLAARMLVAGYLAGLAPSPPARLGVFEAGIVAALVSSGVPPVEALAAAVTLHVCQVVELGLLMTASLVRRRWSWSA